MIQSSLLRRAIAISIVLHAVAAIVGWRIVPTRAVQTELVNIEIAPPAPLPEALPPEVARPPPQEIDRPEPEPSPTETEPASTAPKDPSEGLIDAGVDAAPDAAIDAAPDAAPDAKPDAAVDAAPDAPPDAGVPDAMAVAAADLDAGVPDATTVAATDLDGGVPDATAVASADLDAGAPDAIDVATADAGDSPPQVATSGNDGPEIVVDAGAAAPIAQASDAGADAGKAVAANTGSASSASSDAGPTLPAIPGASSALPGSGAGSGAGSGRIDTAALAAELAAAGSGAPAAPGAPSASDEPAVDGAPTTAGTAANLLAYFPDGHVITALIRFDRLRGTEWSAQTEQLLRPLPDYQMLFGTRDADITAKLETLVISSPRPRDVAATTLVARTQLSRGALRDALGAASPVTWSTARGGLLGRRTSRLVPGDQRVFLSPFQGWFLLAQPGDLGGLTAPTRGKLDTIEATGKLPPWLAGIRAIESETGDKRGPALVVTIALGARRLAITGMAIGLGVRSLPTPERISLAMELVPQGWLVRGNMRFASDADAAELVASVQRVQRRVADSLVFQSILGKPVARVLANLAFARAGPRVSYATSISIADARAILAATAQEIDDYFRRAAAAAPAPAPVDAPR